MHTNNYVYKGYRLTANVSRVAADDLGDSSSPLFSATIRLVPATAVHDDGEEFPVPRFVEGNYAYSPAEAVDAAIRHGCELVMEEMARRQAEMADEESP